MRLVVVPGNGLVEACGEIELVAFKHIVGDGGELKTHHDDGVENVEHHLLAAYLTDGTYRLQQVECLVHLPILLVAQVAGRMRHIILAVGIEMFDIAHLELFDEFVRNCNEPYPIVVGETDVPDHVSTWHNGEVVGVENKLLHIVFHFDGSPFAK